MKEFYRFKMSEILPTQSVTAAKYNNAYCDYHLHSNMEIIYVIKGSLSMKVSGSSRILKDKEATIIFPFEPHSFCTQSDNECAIFVFPMEAVDEFSSKIKNSDYENGIITLSDSVISYVSGEITFNKTIIDPLRAKALLYPLCSEFYDKCHFKPAKKQYETTFMEALQYIYGNFNNDSISLNSAAEFIGVHPAYLSRTFTKNCGMSFTRFLNNTRVSYAVAQLECMADSGKNITQIALESGFGCIRSFNRSFCEFTGMSPTKYLSTFANMQ